MGFGLCLFVLQVQRIVLITVMVLLRIRQWTLYFNAKDGFVKRLNVPNKQGKTGIIFKTIFTSPF